jgi:hypothetical protein
MLDAHSICRHRCLHSAVVAMAGVVGLVYRRMYRRRRRRRRADGRKRHGGCDQDGQNAAGNSQGQVSDDGAASIGE